MDNKKITVITPSVRPEMLPIIWSCLNRQTFKNFEWLTVIPYTKDWENFMKGLWLRDKRSTNVIKLGEGENYLIFEPPKRDGDYYSLNKAWNEGFKHSKGELIVSVQDGLWFPPDMLEKLWYHYLANPKACVGAIGHQYNQMASGKPEGLVWSDPRARQDLGSFYEVDFPEIEWTICSVPKRALYEIGGIDEEYDKYAALSEKDANHRMSKLGYKFYLDQSIEYRAIHHPRLNDEWEKRYQEGCKIYLKHGEEIIEGKRLKLSYLKD